MVHGDPNTHQLSTWMMPYDAYEKVRDAYLERGYTSVDKLMARYDDSHWVIVQEVQNIDTLTCFYLCYLAGKRGGVKVRHSSGFKYVSPQRMDVGLHVIGYNGLWFWDALEACGYTKNEMVEWRYGK